MIDVHFVQLDHEHTHDLTRSCWCGPRSAAGTWQGQPAVLLDHRSDTVGPFDVFLVGGDDPAG